MAGLSVKGELAEYLAEIAACGFALGELDCCTFMAGWLMRIGLPDAMADRRGSYATRAQYRAALRGEGGLAASCARRFAAIGLAAAERASPGDVALVQAPFAVRRGRALWRPTGAICVAVDRLAVVASAGLVISRFPVVASWRTHA